MQRSSSKSFPSQVDIIQILILVFIFCFVLIIMTSSTSLAVNDQIIKKLLILYFTWISAAHVFFYYPSVSTINDLETTQNDSKTSMAL